MKPSLGLVSPLLAVMMLVGGGSLPTQAQIVSAPGDANTVVNQTGTTFNITGGTQAGNNLFHGFQKFGLTSGQTATFLTNPAIQNILGRVTGGEASVINGTIQVTGSAANLYLMNPAGIVFGPNSSLNVPGSFYATTANGIGMGDRWFNASGPNDYASLTGTPGSFTFTMSQPGAIVNAGFLQVTGGNQTLGLIGGTVLSVGGLSAPTGQVVVAAVPGNSLVTLTAPGSPLSLQIQSPISSSSLPNNWALPIVALPQLLTGGSVVNATDVTVSGNQVTLTGSGIAIVPGDVSVRGVSAQTATLSANNNLLLVQGGVSQVFSANTVGDLTLTAQNRVQLQDNAADFSTVSAGGKLTIQGTQGIDLDLLNHPRTYLLTGGDLNLVSNGTITGNARLITGGNLAVRNLSGGAGNLVYTAGGAGSNSQGLISANGDVSFGNYSGDSLKVEAKGSITGGNITITDRNAVVQGTDPDIGILASAPSLILRAGVAELRNPVNVPAGTLGGASFTPSSTVSPGNITVGTVTIAPPGAQLIDKVFGPVILSATGNLQVNGTIQANAFDSGSGQTNGSPVILSAPTGAITVTGDVLGSSVRILSKNDTTVGRVSGLPSLSSLASLAIPGGSVLLSSSAGNVTTQTIAAPFGSVDVKAFGLFKALGTFQTNFTIAGGGLKNVPLSIQGNGRVTIQHGGSDFLAGLGVERDQAGNPVFRIVPGDQRVFLPTSQFGNFLDANGTPVTLSGGQIVTVKSVPFDPTGVAADTSFTTGLVVLKGGIDAGLYGVFRDTQLPSSQNITVTQIPRPTTPVIVTNPTDPTITTTTNTTTPTITTLSNSIPENQAGSLNTVLDSNSSEAQTAQRQFTQLTPKVACSPTNTSTASNQRGTNGTTQPGSVNPCAAATGIPGRILQIESGNSPAAPQPEH